MNLTPEVLADLRDKATQATRTHRAAQIAGPAALALLDRIEALEAKWERPSRWRCDGCGAHETSDDGRRPDRHDGCGGVWLRIA